MSEQVLTARQLNRALLARQLLLESADLPVARAIEQVGCLQTQYAPSGYIGLWSRLRDFRREALTASLEDGSVVQATLLRATIHMASAPDYRLMAAATGPTRREWWARVTRRELADINMTAVAEATRIILADGPRPAAEIQARLEELGYPRMAWASVGQWLDMVRVPPSGTWARRKADLYGLADEWLRDSPDGAGLGSPSEPAGIDAGLDLLVGRYLGAFGPAPVKDIANWAGLAAPTLIPAVERLDLRRFRDEGGGPLLDLRDAPLPDPGAQAPIRFLPTWDATLLAHARRAKILPEEFRPLVFNTRTPHSVPTFLVDGAVAGTWRHEKGRVGLNPFAPLPAKTMRDLESEAERLAAFHAD